MHGLLGSNLFRQDLERTEEPIPTRCFLAPNATFSSETFHQSEPGSSGCPRRAPYALTLFGRWSLGRV